MGKQIIRFYPIKLMDDLTIEDLKAAGFEPIRWKSIYDSTTQVDKTTLVHQSVGILKSQPNDYKEHPTIKYYIGGEDSSTKVAKAVPALFESTSGLEAKWGAMRFPLRNQKELHEFMQMFNYPIPNGTQSNP